LFVDLFLGRSPCFRNRIDVLTLRSPSKKEEGRRPGKGGDVIRLLLLMSAMDVEVLRGILLVEEPIEGPTDLFTVPP
jgi:hypothetical protein